MSVNIRLIEVKFHKVSKHVQEHTLQSNPQHREEEPQNTNSHNLRKLNEVKQPTLSSSSRWLLN